VSYATLSLSTKAIAGFAGPLRAPLGGFSLPPLSYVGLSLSSPVEPTRTSLLTADDVAASLGVSRDWVYSEVRAARIPHIRLGRHVRFRSESIDAWILESERGKIAQTS
jgi:excisionase family DNA binding protein